MSFLNPQKHVYLATETPHPAKKISFQSWRKKGKERERERELRVRRTIEKRKGDKEKEVEKERKK